MAEEIKETTQEVEETQKTYTVEEYSTLESKYDSLKAQYEALRNQFDEVTKTLENLGDIEDIKAKKDEYKAQAEKIKADFDKLVYQTAVEKYVNKLNIEDSIHKDFIMNEIVKENLQLKDGELLGVDKILDNLKVKYPQVFAQEGNTPKATFTSPQSTQKVTVTFDDFKKMGLAERIKLKKENLDLYNSFTNKK